MQQTSNPWRGECRDTNGHGHTIGCGLVGAVSWAPGGTRPHASRREVPSPWRRPVARRFAAVRAGCVSDTNGDRGICLALARQRQPCRTVARLAANATPPLSLPAVVEVRGTWTEGRGERKGCYVLLRIALFRCAIQRIQPTPISDKLAQLRRLDPLFHKGRA